MKPFKLAVYALLAFVFSFSAASAADMAVVLSIDVSGSVDSDEYGMQMQGTAAALEDENFVATLNGREVMIAVVQWSSEARVVVPWFTVHDEASAKQLAAIVRNTPRSINSAWTALGNAMATSIALLDEVDAPRKVIDISGDGVSNNGIDVAETRALAEARGISVNGLPILSEDPNLEAYYRSNVITSDGFVVAARSHGDIGNAMRQKFSLEIASN